MKFRLRLTMPIFATFLCFTVVVPHLAAFTFVEKQLGNQTSDVSKEEIEPALITYTQFGVEYSVAVAMQFDPNVSSNPSAKLRFYAWTSAGQSSTGDIPFHTDYDRYADPVLAKSPTSTRLYLAALCLSQTSGNRAVAVWTSANGGWTWSSPRIIDTSTPSVPGLDKPAITVGPDGRIWVAYITHSGSNLLWVVNGTLSGSTWNWSAPHRVLPNGSSAQAPQVMVDSNSDVYILYTAAQKIQLVRDNAGVSDGGLSFTKLSDVPGIGTLYAGSVSDFVALKSGVELRMTTVPVAKLDRARRRISVAWHESDGAGGSCIRFAAMRTDVMPPALPAWTLNPPILSVGAGYHNVNVGMDFNPATGDYLVTYYSFPKEQAYYFNYGVWVSFDVSGTPQAEAPAVVSNRRGWVEDYTAVSGTVQRLLGEYHDVSFTNGRFKSVHILVDGTGDPWVFTVTH